jgi:hypothetical protein
MDHSPRRQAIGLEFEMISSVLALLLATSTAQAPDPSARAREAYARCLHTFLERSVGDRMTPEDFDSALEGQCAAQQATLRDVVIRRETSFGANREAAEQDAELELDELKANYRELFRAHMEE